MEKVVKPPSIPAVKNKGIKESPPKEARSNPGVTNPIRNEPVRFTNRIASGKSMSALRSIHATERYLNPPPRKLPSPTIKAALIIDPKKQSGLSSKSKSRNATMIQPIFDGTQEY